MDIFHPDFGALRAKANHDAAGANLLQQAMANADAALQKPLPSKNIPEFEGVMMREGRYTAEYLTALTPYDNVSWLFENSFTALAFAYRLTQRAEYLNHFCRCVDACFLNPYWGPPAARYDHCSSRICRALSIAAVWLEDSLPCAVQDKIAARLRKELEGFLAKYKKVSSKYPLGPNDHQWKDIAGAGMAAYYLLPNNPEMQAVIDRFIWFFDAKMLPESISAQGGWIDGYDVAMYSFLDTIFFFECVKEQDNKDLSQHPHLVASLEHFAAALPVHASYTYDYSFCYFWLAANYRRGDFQYMALTGLKNRQFDTEFAAYSLLFYDPIIDAKEPEITAENIPDYGLARLGSGFNHKQVYVWQKSGPHNAFYERDANGISVTAYGVPLLSSARMRTKKWDNDYVKIWNAVYEDDMWSTPCTNSLMANGLPQQQNQFAEDWPPLAKFQHAGMDNSHETEKWWCLFFDAPKEPMGHMLGVVEKDGWRGMSGVAHPSAYSGLLQAHTRHTLQISEQLIVALDYVEPSDTTRFVWVRLNSDAAITPQDSGALLELSGIYGGLTLASPAGAPILTYGTRKFLPGIGGYLNAEWTVHKKALLVTALWASQHNHTAIAPQISITESDFNYVICVTAGGKSWQIQAPIEGFAKLCPMDILKIS